jgi:hypothetical protein
MNKIVVEHYPVERLPEDLRAGLHAAVSVKITVEAEDDGGMAVDDVVAAARRRLAARDGGGVSMEEAVARIRSLRDEWDD